MGCDIHGFIDYPRYQGPRSCVAALHLARNYDLFALLAGVRTRDAMKEYAPVFQPRGLPHDLTEWVAEQFDEDAHTPSWLTTDEVGHVLKVYDAVSPYPRGADTDGLLAMMQALPDARLIFWFDN